MKAISKPSSIVSMLFLFLILLSCNATSQVEIEDETPTEELEDTVEETEEETSEEPENTNYDISSILSIFDNVDAISYTVTSTSVIINTTNLPNHKSPYYEGTDWETEMYTDYSGTNSNFRLNPNRIGEQQISITIPLHPEEADNKEATPMGPMGISRNGVVFFNQYAAGFSALDNEIDSFDQYLGHPAGTGAYHYHIEPVYLTETFGEDALLGLLADGFPVYGPLENDAIISTDDLDDYHGHYGATKEFPNGIYHYHVTATAPYINGDGFYGTPGNISR